MKLLLDGILLGLVLSVSIGPIFFALVQTSIRQGIIAGIFVGTGIWISDLLCILVTYFGLSSLGNLIKTPSFLFYSGVVGGIFLIIFGLLLFFKKPPSLEQLRSNSARDESILSLWLKGFLINTINPFTIFFWLTTMTDGVINRSFSTAEVLLFFGGILGTIIITDFLKAYFADKIRKKLYPIHLKYLGRFAGIIVFGFGMALMYRGIVAI